ncbi:zeta toxin family protein [Chitinophaga sp. RCC_12]|uniref:zeta toxin family protein n=1 Tax=Chitinophaga sp. RCC_12 TaxID=3239226 RepID=UPI003526175E
MPSLFIITGSNGAGKSSVGAGFLPLEIQQKCSIFDGDKLYMQKQKELWAEGIRAHKEAKKLALAFVEDTFDNLVEKALVASADFVYEGHFTNDATWNIPKRFKEAGYNVNMIFLGLDDPDLSELRVIDRTKEGGHYVPRNVIEDNFYGILRN